MCEVNFSIAVAKNFSMPFILLYITIPLYYNTSRGSDLDFFFVGQPEIYK